MGNRAFIQIDSKSFEMPIIFYGHWSGEDNLQAVRNVLSRTDRIGDANYLAAQIFYEFAVVFGGYTGELSFGISSGEVSSSAWADVETIWVNADTGEYKYCGELHSEFAILSLL